VSPAVLATSETAAVSPEEQAAQGDSSRDRGGAARAGDSRRESAVQDALETRQAGPFGDTNVSPAGRPIRRQHT
jgi:hypothetical protein